MRIRIDGELFHVDDWRRLDAGLCEVETEEGESFILAEDDDTAEKAAKDHYREMDGKELVCMVGEDEVINMWKRGDSFEDWLDGLDTAQELAGYDGCERTVNRVGVLAREIGFTPTLAYRTH